MIIAKPLHEGFYTLTGDSWKQSFLECSMSKSLWAQQNGNIQKLLSETCEMDVKGLLLLVMKNVSHDDFVDMMIL